MPHDDLVLPPVYRWLFWLLLSGLLTVLQLIYAIYQLIRIIVDLSMISTLKFYTTAWRFVTRRRSSQEHKLKEKLTISKSLKSYEKLTALDEDMERSTTEWRESTKDLPQAAVLEKTTAKLWKARNERKYDDLQFLLSGILKRDHMGITDEDLHSRCGVGTKNVVEAFQLEVETCLEALVTEETVSLETKLAFFKKERRSLGQTALCLSGGGSICMYHIGIIKALVEAGLYKHIRVLSGTSGGSIIAAMVACKTDEELLEEVVNPCVSTDFKGDGSQAELGIRWFPPLKDQLVNFLRNRVLMDKLEFKRCCDWYYGEVTFAEAYAKTKRHVSISVSYSQLGGNGEGPGRLLLNHISSPHVTLASAVAASCALPGIMASQNLEAKDSTGRISPVDADGVSYVDGSLAADLPFKRMATLFNVSNFIVAQVNFHVLPFMRKAHSPSRSSTYWQILTFLEHDIRHRARRLARLGLLPTFFGQSMSGVFKQKYHGDVTIVPGFTALESIGLKAVMNPTKKDIEGYITGGERATWPHVNRIRFMLRTETCLRRCVMNLQSSLESRPVEDRSSSHFLQLSSLNSISNFQALDLRSGSDTHEFGLLVDDDDPNDVGLDFESEVGSGEERIVSGVQSEHGGLAQLRWEMGLLAKEVKSLRAENSDLRGRLLEISSIADAGSRSPVK